MEQSHMKSALFKPWTPVRQLGRGHLFIPQDELLFTVKKSLPQFVPFCASISAVLLVLVHHLLLTTLLRADDPHRTRPSWKHQTGSGKLSTIKVRGCKRRPAQKRGHLKFSLTLLFKTDPTCGFHLKGLCAVCLDPIVVHHVEHMEHILKRQTVRMKKTPLKMHKFYLHDI